MSYESVKLLHLRRQNMKNGQKVYNLWFKEDCLLIKLIVETQLGVSSSKLGVDLLLNCNTETRNAK